MLPEGRKKTASCRETATKKETARVGEDLEGGRQSGERKLGRGNGRAADEESAFNQS